MGHYDSCYEFDDEQAKRNANLAKKEAKDAQKSDVWWAGYNAGYTAGFQAQRRMGDTCLDCGSSGNMGPGSVQQPTEPHPCDSCTQLRERARRLSGELGAVKCFLQSAIQSCDALGKEVKPAQQPVVRACEAGPNNQMVGRAADEPQERYGANFVGAVPQKTQIRATRQAPAYRKLSIGFGVPRLDATDGTEE